jgi:hypothetical protein
MRCGIDRPAVSDTVTILMTGGDKPLTDDARIKALTLIDELVAEILDLCADNDLDYRQWLVDGIDDDYN